MGEQSNINQIQTSCLDLQSGVQVVRARRISNDRDHYDNALGSTSVLPSLEHFVGSHKGVRISNSDKCRPLLSKQWRHCMVLLLLAPLALCFSRIS
jgi:hypothetical protein